MAEDGRIDILGLTRQAFEAEAGLGPGRSRALGALYKASQLEGRFEPGTIGISREAAASLEGRFRLGLLEPVKVVEEEGPLGVTAKALLRLADGECVECVRIPAGRGPKAGGADGRVTDGRVTDGRVTDGRVADGPGDVGDSGAASGQAVDREGPATLCVSSQVGCRMGCAFCETGRGGLVRNLSAAEIVAELVTVRVLLGWRISNLVFMGMGEPLDNFEAVSGALAAFLDRSGHGFSQESITVCTVGLAEGIGRLRGLGLKRLNLSVSLNAPDDGSRSALMPVDRSVPLDALARALAAYPQRRNFALGVNYCLIPGLNDGPGAAEGVAAFLAKAAPPGRALVNLIPYNPGSAPVGRAPTEAEIEAFEARLAASGVQVKLRLPRGRGLMAACGQLGSAAKRGS